MATQISRKSLPKNELKWTTYELDDGRFLYITSTKMRDKYFLWEKNGADYTMIMSGATPKKLIEKANAILETPKKKKTKGKSKNG